MSKYVYVGGSSVNDYARFEKAGHSVTLKQGVPTEVPAELEFRVKDHPHFQRVDEPKPAASAPPKDPPNDPPKDPPKDSGKK